MPTSDAAPPRALQRYLHPAGRASLRPNGELRQNSKVVRTLHAGLSATLLGANGTEWRLVGAGDFNGDGRADLLFRRTDGTLSMYLMNGTQVLDARIIGHIGTEWEIVGVGDLNGDGRADLLARRGDGMLAGYLFSGFQVLQSALLGNVGVEECLIMKISVVTPLYLSAGHVAELHARATAAVHAAGATEHEIVLVNDGSPDDGLAEARKVAARDPNVVILDLARNYGQHKAIMAGLAYASGDYVFVMDSDLEEAPEWVVLFYRELTARQCDLVYGISNLDRGLAYRTGHRMFYGLIAALSDAPLPGRVCTARLMTRRYVEALLQFTESEVYLAGICHLAGFAQVPIEVEKRHSSPTTYTPGRLAALFVDGITTYSTRPLLAISIAGIGLFAVALLFTGWIVAQKLLHGIAVEGWASVMAVMLLYGGLSLFFNGVIAIYVAKIFIEVKRRPRTIVREVIGADVRPGTDAISRSDPPDR